VRDAHLHPLRDPLFDSGVNFEILDLAEAAGGNGNGALDPGERIALSVTIRDDAGGDVLVSWMKITSTQVESLTNTPG